GRPLTWTTFKKQELLDELEIPTPVHLALVSVLTANDYTDGMPLYKLTSNLAKVKQIATENPDVASKEDQAKWIYDQIEKYIETIHQKAVVSRRTAVQSCQKRSKRIEDPSSIKAHQKEQRRIASADKQLEVQIGDFDNALRALVHCEETAVSGSGSIPGINIHARLVSIINSVEIKKASRSWNRFASSRAGPSSQTEPSSTPSPTLSAPITELGYRAPPAGLTSSS
ncbi:hypothetical protein BGZ83_004146, partial [Gryganskiella cystojenkinii]